MQRKRRAAALVLALSVASVTSLVLCVGIGPVFINPGTVARIILSGLPGFSERFQTDWTQTEYAIVMLTRLPRVLLGFCVGCALAFSGVSMQTLVRNELADPYILGVSYGAAAFASVGIITGLFSFMGVYQNAVNGCIGAALSMLCVYFYSLHRGRMNIDQLLLGGIALSLFTKAVVKVVALTNPQVFLHSTSGFWTQGGLAGSRWAYMGWPILLMVVCALLLAVRFRSLNALVCGDETALTLGVSVSRMQKGVMLATSGIIGVTVSVSGGIGFVGLIAPHVARMLVGSDHRRVFPVAALMGGVFVLWCDVAARMLFAPEELSVGIVTALVGGPAFLWMLRKKVV
jgi:iron complex transport system permease protein